MEIKDRVLVVEDDKRISNFIKTVLEANNYDVIVAQTGAEAYSMVTSQCPDVVILDLGLPDMDGMKILQGVREWSAMPVIVVSARTHERDKVEALDLGADDYITKPFDVEILRSKINSLMKKRDDMKRYFSNSSAASHNEENTLSTNPFMDAVVKNIEKHLDASTFEAKVLADSLNMSLPTLYRKIKQYSDLSILELTRNIRLKKAAELLASQQYSVQEVAEMVGFNDTATFRKRFTEQYGVTPSQYGIPA